MLGILFYMLPLLTDRLGRGFDLETHRGLVDSWRPLRYPSVDVFLPVCGEPLEVLRNTWSYVARALEASSTYRLARVVFSDSSYGRIPYYIWVRR